MKTENTRPKIFCVGWHKTGTTTMGEALLKLGYNVVGARLDLAASLLNDDIQEAIKLAEKYDAFQDVPWAALYKELDEAFPGSKFILTIRDEQKWLFSAKKHFGENHTDMRQWLYGLGVLVGNEDLYLERFRRHNEEIQAYFQNRKDDFITMSWTDGDGWEKLCQFLDVPIPATPFPHANKGKHRRSFTQRFFYGLRSLIPKATRRKLLDLLGLSRHNRNRFNNYEQNQKNL